MSRYELIQPAKPSLFERFKRSIYLGPFNPKDKKLAELFGGRQASSGISVNESSALSYSAVFSAIQLIAGDVASTPLMLYKRVGEGKEQYRDHPLFRLLHDQANPDMSAFTFRETLQGHVLSWGNGYAEIERDGANRPRYLWPITPDRVTLERDGSRWRYRVTNSGDRDVFLDPQDMLHIPGLGFDGMTGYAVISKMRESIGLGIAAERFGGTFFGEGAWFGGLFTTEKTVDEKTKQNFLDSMNAQHKGVDRAHRVGLVGGGLKFIQLGIPPDDAQFLETRQFQVTEIARWFGVPPHKIGDLSKATFSNIEQQNREYFQTTLIRWLERWEQILMLKLISPLERNMQMIEFVTEGILRGDSAGRAALESAQFNIGALTPNEARGFDNRNPVAGGERAFIQRNMMPLDKVDALIDAEIESKKAPPPAPPPEPPPSRAAQDHIDFLKDRVAFQEKDEGKLRAQITAIESERDEYAQKMRAAQQRADDLAAAQEQAVGERDEARAECAHLNADLQSAREAVNAEHLLRTQAECAREEQAAIASAAVAEAQKAEAGQAAAVQRAEQAERDKVVAEQAQAAANDLLEQKRQTQSKRMIDVIGSHRALMVDAMRRLITKETDRARKHQATPQKLRSWVETFYEEHAEYMSDVLEPIIRVHLAWMQSERNAVELAAAIADCYVEDSRQQLRDVLACEDFAPAFAKMLERWEQKRPEAIADQFVREGLEYARSL